MMRKHNISIYRSVAVLLCAFFPKVQSTNVSETSSSPPFSSTSASTALTSANAPSISSSSSIPGEQVSQSSRILAIKPNTDVVICACDLTSGLCDINCCCDEDCSDQDREAFRQCDDVIHFINIIDCVQNQTVIRHYKSNVEEFKSSSIFCIYKDNYSSRKFYTIPEIVKTAEGFDSYRRLLVSRGYAVDTSSQNLLRRTDIYQNGAPILLHAISENATEYFQLPASGIVSECSTLSSVLFLSETSQPCTRILNSPLNDSCEKLGYLNARVYTNDIEILSTPGGQQHVPVVNLSMINSPKLNSSSGYCESSVSKVAFDIYHLNGAIKKVEVAIDYVDLLLSTAFLHQEFSVKFRDDNETSDLFKRSGNPGYITGKPVLAGRLNGTFIVVNGDQSSYLTIVRASADGSCLTDMTSRIPVQFGENVRSGCLLTVTEADVSDLCEVFQRQALDALLGPSQSINTDGSTYIASFGNSDPLKPGDWVPLISTRPRSTCSGLAMHLEFIYSRVGPLSNPQSRIIGARLVLEETPIQFICTSSYCSQGHLRRMQRFEMITSVSFIDVSSTPTPAIAEQPVFSAKLPYDFFHPYYLSACSELACNLPLTLFLELVIYLLTATYS